MHSRLIFFASLAICAQFLGIGRAVAQEEMQSLTEEVASLPTWFQNHREVPERASGVYRDKIGRVARLADLDTVSFRLDLARFRHKDLRGTYFAAFRRFPSVRSCLRSRSSPAPDLSEIDWSRIKNHSEALVCFSWIATSYETIGDFYKWMIAQGFTVRIRKLKEGTVDGRYLLRGEIDLNGREPLYEIERNFLQKLTKSFERPYYLLGVRFGDDGGLIDMGIRANGWK